MGKCLKDGAIAKNFGWNKSSSHSQRKLEKLVGGGGGGHPPPLAFGGLTIEDNCDRVSSGREGQ